MAVPKIKSYEFELEEMRRVFKSEKFQQEFEENGFIKIPFLSEAQVDLLLTNYRTIEEEHTKIGIPFITTSHSNNSDLIRKADEMIAAVFHPEMEKLLDNYQLLFGNFLIKSAGLESITPPHQDTTFVDESKFSSISFWVSLEDTNKNNGCMRFIKGSHKFLSVKRPSHSYLWAFENVKPELEKMMTDFPSRKGEAFIFHHAVIHASYGNQTQKPRVAAVMAAYPSEAELWMVFQKPNFPELLQTYSMSKEAYLNFVKGVPPSLGNLINEEPTDFLQLSKEDFTNLTIPKLSFFSKLLKPFGIKTH
jgi:hypothetical protein